MPWELLWEFVKDVFDSWVERVGIVLTILPFIEKIPPVERWLKKKPLLERYLPLLWIIAVVFIFWGFFSAWRAQRTENSDLSNQLQNLTVPHLEGEISQISSGRDPLGRFILYTQVSVMNSSGAPSGAKSWFMNVRCPDGRVFHNGIPVFNIGQKEAEIKMNKKGNVVLDMNPEHMISKEMQNPLVAGAEVLGWYLAVFPEIKSIKDVSGSGCKAYLYFNDIVGNKSYTLESALPENNFKF